MSRIFLLLAVATLFATANATANAESWNRHKQYQSRTWHSAPVQMRGRGAFGWQPNQCWTDEGYGRRSPCSGRSN
jgi:hypothetical protein